MTRNVSPGADAWPNPLIPGMNPDPSCIQVDDHYYAITSTFEYLPAIPVYRSDDLRTWHHIGNVATRQEQVGLLRCPAGGGVWAPTIRYFRGTFHVIVTVANSPRGCVLFTAQDPAGPWSDGLSFPGIYGIDPDLAWDGDDAYVTFSGLHRTESSIGPLDGIMQARVDLTSGELLEEPRRLWSGTGLSASEGPHLHLRDGFWYLFIAEGGTERGHAVSVARSRSIQGPFEGAPHNPVLTASGLDRPVISTGHGDLVTAPDGRDALLLLGTRPVDRARAFSVLGRETFVTTVDWIDGWPTPRPVELAPRQEPCVEHFELAGTAALDDPGWLAVRRPPAAVLAAVPQTRDGWLTLQGEGELLRSRTPAYVGRRQRHLACSVEVEVDCNGGSGGLALRFDEESSLTLLAERGTDPAVNTISAKIDLPGLCHSTSIDVPGGLVILRLGTKPPAPRYPPWAEGGDIITLSVVDANGGETEVANLDGRYWAVETATPFTGRVIGMIADDGRVHFRHFRYHGAAGT
ncbi:beta-xylosidase [Kibdelosporangium banguiense]|uniref:Beta-xylosidase n=1 Tax=Kibdelosporangium banguiense TaxID=1365924 RepID=A0ABS4TX30_9PSEU|nr:family 43 glycosylhydrolase [Kibdelosporangium banguiense]MBP2328968.1 beta-xylosidase [Kibdelosporangium banguiense]